MLALARTCSSNESAIGIPAISAGPCSGTCTCTTGRDATLGVSSVVSGCSHNCTSAAAARRSKLSHPALGRLALLGELLDRGFECRAQHSGN